MLFEGSVRHYAMTPPLFLFLPPGTLLFEGPQSGNSLISTWTFSSASSISGWRGASCVKLGHLLKMSVPSLAELLDMRLNRLLHRLVEEACMSLPETRRAFAEDCTPSDQWNDAHECVCVCVWFFFPFFSPSLAVPSAAEYWRDDRPNLLSLKTPSYGYF